MEMAGHFREWIQSDGEKYYLTGILCTPKGKEVYNTPYCKKTWTYLLVITYDEALLGIEGLGRNTEKLCCPLVG